MNDIPNIAIIIANYNYGKYVVSAIDSAIKQDYPSCKTFIVNDGSNDNSLELILNYANKLTKLHEERIMVNYPYYSGKLDKYEFSLMTVLDITNSGASTARNVGIWAAWDWADMFAILDADDVYYPHKVSTMINKMQDPHVGVVYADYDIQRPLYTKREYKQPYNKQALYKECIVHSGSLIRKTYLEKVILDNKEFYDSKLHGPLSKGFIGCTEDYDLWLRLSNHCIINHVPESLSLVRETGQNQSFKMTGDIFNKNMEIIKRR